MGKGGTFENEIAKQLSLWFTDGQRDDIFGRSDGSGGRFTSRWKKGKTTASQSGDITFIDILGEPLIKIWNIEVKTGYSGKKNVKDADGDAVKIPIYGKAKKGEEKKKQEERTIIGWKTKKSLVMWDILDVIDSHQKTPVIEQMWTQCSRDADLTNCHPILIFRRNSRPSCICMRRAYYLKITEHFGRFPDAYVILNNSMENLMIIPLKKFFEWATPASQILLD